MLAIYDMSHVKVGPLVNYSNYHIERAKGQLDLLYFTISTTAPEFSLLVQEGYIATESHGEYVIKEININDSESPTADVVADLNVEPLKGTRLDTLVIASQTATDAVNLALAGTGWSVGTSNVTRTRSVKQANVMVFDALTAIESAFNCELEFDTVNKHVNIYQKRGQDRGVYFAEQLNLKELGIQGSSRSLITCLIPIGKDGLTISSVNGGVDYITNHQYSSKNVFAYWEDNRYEIAQNLYDDAVERLDYLSKPTVAYSASILDLARTSPDNYSILDYDYGDTITILAESKGVKTLQRIVKIDIYPDSPESNTCEIANRVASLDELDVRFLGIADTVETVTTQDGMVDGSKVEVLPDSNLGIATAQTLNAVVAKIGTLMVTKLEATDLTAINANISNLQADKANVSDLTAINANITNLQTADATINNALITKASIESVNAVVADVQNLQADKADITDLNATNAEIDTLQANEATIVTLLANSADINSLTTDEIKANYAALAIGQIDTAQIKYGAIDTAQIQNGAIVNALIGNEAVDTAQIKDLSVTDGKIVELTATKITSGTLSTERLIIRDPSDPSKSLIYSINNISGALQSVQGETINGEVLTDLSITADKIVAHSITTNQLSANCITANEIMAGAITADSGILAEACIGEAQIAKGAITAAKISDLIATVITAGILQSTDKTPDKTIVFDLDNNKFTIGHHELKLETNGSLSFTSQVPSDVMDYQFKKATADKCDIQVDGTIHTTGAFSWGYCKAERRDDEDNAYANPGVDFVF